MISEPELLRAVDGRGGGFLTGITTLKLSELGQTSQKLLRKGSAHAVSRPERCLLLACFFAQLRPLAWLVAFFLIRVDPYQCYFAMCYAAISS